MSETLESGREFQWSREQNLKAKKKSPARKKSSSALIARVPKGKVTGLSVLEELPQSEDDISVSDFQDRQIDIDNTSDRIPATELTLDFDLQLKNYAQSNNNLEEFVHPLRKVDNVEKDE